LTAAINTLVGTLSIECGAADNSTNTATCYFKQATLQTLFGENGLGLNGCLFGECVTQNVIDTSGGSTSSSSTQASKTLSSGVIAGLAAVCGLVFLSLLLFALGLRIQKLARKTATDFQRSNVGVEWSRLSYIIPNGRQSAGVLSGLRRRGGSRDNDKVVLDSVSGSVRPGQMMAILGPSGNSFLFGTTRALNIFRGWEDDSRRDSCGKKQIRHCVWGY
jgi:ABC-type multidrug transport system fused ATPase/permease subunit